MKQFQENRIEFLTLKFLEEGLNVEEKVELKSLLQIPEMHAYFKQTYLLWSASSERKEEDIEQAWQKISAQMIETPNRIKRNQWGWGMIAAASVAIFILGMGTYHFIFDSSKQLSKDFSKKLLSESSVPTANNKITVPLGSRSKIELPDGTFVTLNAGSQLEYSTDYGIDHRDVSLEGEAYFKVAKNKNSTFTVRAKNTTIKALGTEFNVKAYADENFVQTTLIEGSVSINPNIHAREKANDIVLIPNQMATILEPKSSESLDSKKNNTTPIQSDPSKSSIEMDAKGIQVSLSKVDPVLYTSWKDPRWIIEGEEMESLALKLQRRYDVNVVLASPGLKKYKFSGILEDETLEQVLDIMKTVAPINYFVDKKTVVLAINPEQRKAFEKSMSK